MEFKASYLEIQPHELVRQLLIESGQQEREAVNPPDILRFLGLECISFDFQTELSRSFSGDGGRPRAILSFPDRVVAIDSNLTDLRARFSALHEIGHYVLPNHQHSLYVCDERGMSHWTRLGMEREANDFAADLLFQGHRFTLEANSHSISAATVQLLAEKYRASFEATARRLIEKSFRAAMLIVFDKKYAQTPISVDAQPVWARKYTVASASFKTTYFPDIQSAVVPADTVAIVTGLGRSIAESYEGDVTVRNPVGERTPFHGEFFFNQYNIFCILTPVNR